MNIIQLTNLFSKIAKQTDVKRGKVAIEAEHPLNESNKDKFPINKPSEAKKAITRVMSFSEVPLWWGGDLSELQHIVKEKVEKEYEVTEHNNKIIVKPKH